MGKLIVLKAGDRTVLVESSDAELAGPHEAGAMEVVEKNLDKMLEVIKPFCESLITKFETLGKNKPDMVSAEFGLSFSAEGNIFFVKASGEGSVKVTLYWGEVHEAKI